MKKIAAILALTTVSACSIFESKGDEIVFDTALGPTTETQIQNLPAGLEGDTENSNHLGIERKGPSLESADGTSD